MALLREMVAFIRTFPGGWFATGPQVAEAWSFLDERVECGRNRHVEGSVVVLTLFAELAVSAMTVMCRP